MHPLTTRKILGPALLAGCLAFGFLIYLAAWVPAVLYTQGGMDAWFDADLLRVLSNMTDRSADHFSHYRTKVHPLFSILTLPVTTLAHGLTGVSMLRLAVIFDCLVGAAWMAVFFALAAKITASRLVAALLCLLAAGSSGFVFWFPVVETYALGSLTLLVAIHFAYPRLEAGGRAGWRWVLMAIATLSVTITNFAVGCFALAAGLRLRRAVVYAVLAVLVVCFLALAQRRLIPTAGVFFSRQIAEEANYIQPRDDGGPLVKMAHVLASTVVLPPPTLAARPGKLPQASVQKNLFMPRPAVATVALVGWLGLLAAGLVGLWRSEHRRFKVFLFAALGFQLLLHALYGQETFLFAAHSLPILLTVAAFAGRCVPRTLSIGWLAITAAAALWANLAAFQGVVRQFL